MGLDSVCVNLTEDTKLLYFPYSNEGGSFLIINSPSCWTSWITDPILRHRMPLTEHISFLSYSNVFVWFNNSQIWLVKQKWPDKKANLSIQPPSKCKKSSWICKQELGIKNTAGIVTTLADIYWKNFNFKWN